MYDYGKLNGSSVEFFENGSPAKITSYSNGLKNGVNQYYDSLGHLLYSDYYYYDVAVGPIMYYDANGKVERFFFTSFDNRTLLDIDYSSWKGVDNFIPNLINYSYELQQIDSVKGAALFLYTIKLPKMATQYSVYKRNKLDRDDESLITELTGEPIFYSLNLPILSDKYEYSIRLTIYDSLINKKTVINREVW